MGYKVIKIGSLNNIDKTYMHGYYNIGGSASGVPNSSETILHTMNVGSTTSAQIGFQYQSSTYAGRCYFRVGSVPQISDGTATSNWQAWIELHGVGKGYSGNFVSDATNTRNIGSSSNTWANIYTQNAVTVVSDRNAKNSIQAIDDKVLQAWSEVEPKQYKLNGDENWSFGYIAQDIVDAFTRHGLDYKQYNIVHEENGKFMLKYDMCAVLESALNRKRPI